MPEKKTVTAGKVPPQNLDAEMSMLGAILIDDEVIADASELVAPGDFYDKRHQVVYAAMMRLYEKHKPVDLLTLTDELKKKDQLEAVGGSAYLTELTNYVPTAAHASSYAEIVSQKAVRRRLIKASAEISEMGFDEDTTTQELLEKAEAELFSVSDQSLKQDLVSIESILTDSFDRIEELHRNKGQLRGIRTGYRDLDNMTAGLQRSDLIILAAQTVRDILESPRLRATRVVVLHPARAVFCCRGVFDHRVSPAYSLCSAQSFAAKNYPQRSARSAFSRTARLCDHHQTFNRVDAPRHPDRSD
jgi:replicative DNA helicase